MLGDTLTVTINAVAKTLIKVNQDKYSAEYRLRETDGVYTMNVRHSSYSNGNGQTVDRHNVELIHDLYAVAPATVGISHKSYLTFSCLVRTPRRCRRTTSWVLQRFSQVRSLESLLTTSLNL